VSNLWRKSGEAVSARRVNSLLVLLGVASLVLYRYGLRAQDEGDLVRFIKLSLVQSGLYLIVVWAVWRARPARSTLLLAVAFAALFRLSILFAPPSLSVDVYRYVWDGRVQAAGVNPYRYVPADDALSRLRDEAIYPKIDRRDYARTMYPPVAEATYLLATRVSESVTWMKAVMVGFEAVAVWALVELLASFGLPRQRVLVYAWHPLAVWEFAGSGHVDAAAIAFIALALLARGRRMETATGVALGCAALVKLYPAVLLPGLYRRWGWKMPAAFAVTVVAGYLPYLSVGLKGALGFLPGYMDERGMLNGEQFYLLGLIRWRLPGVPLAAFIVFALLALSAVALWSVFKPGRDRDGYVARALALASTFTVLLSPDFPWYFSWLVPFLCFVPLPPLFYLSAAAFILYGAWLGPDPSATFIFLNTILYVPAAFLAALAGLSRRRKRARARKLTDGVDEDARVGLEARAGAPSSGRVSVIIAALNEEETIAEVVCAVPREVASEVIVVDNGSEDRTAERARAAGARVVTEPRRGYGRAFRTGIDALGPGCEVVVFLDGDGSDCPELMGRLVRPIVEGTHDFVLGSRISGRREPGSMLFHQVMAGHMIGLLLRALYGVRYTDMGPFRAIRRDAFLKLDMREETYGWPLEMQMKAARARLRILEVPVDYRRRAGGVSKISGSLRGSFLAATRILLTLARVARNRA
jgi:hypothetical protein